MHLFTYNGKTSREFGVTISGQDTWRKAAPDLERVSIPGRNGELILTNKRYNNVNIPYQCGIIRSFDENYKPSAVRSGLSQAGGFLSS